MRHSQIAGCAEKDDPPSVNVTSGYLYILGEMTVRTSQSVVFNSVVDLSELEEGMVTRQCRRTSGLNLNGQQLRQVPEGCGPFS